jgi:LacI family transcriptional regulator
MADASQTRTPVTIRDVARAANVHISTVSRALDPQKSSLVSHATRARILAAADELGYRPHLIASGLRRGQTRTIGVVVPDLDNPLYAPFAHGVAHALDGGGYMPLVADTQDDHERLQRILHHLVGRRVDGVITTAARMADQDAFVQLAEDGVPVVLAVRTLPRSGLPAVLYDDYGGGRLAATHLLDLGHQALGQVQGPLDVEPFRARTRGFIETVRERGADVLLEVPPATRPTVQDGERVTRALLDAAESLPTGLFVQNDTLALGALQALRDAGIRCPEDISVVGYNDAFFAAHACPPLTTIRLPGYGVGHLAGRMVIEAIQQGTERHNHAVVPATLVARASTAPPRR